MDADPSTHPTHEILQGYGLGKLDDASAQVVSKHLEDCPDCRRQFTEMAPDGFLGRLRDAPEIPESSAFGSAIPGGSATGTTVAEDAIVDSASAPCMSSTGQVDATSAALDSPGETSLQSGTRIGYFGDYELLKVLGEGGMGIVYKALQLSLNRLVAVKMVRASRFPSADDERRFQNEAEAVARLDHPNIVPIFEIGQYEDQHYFSMKLIAGESLDKRSKDYLANPRRAAEIVAMTAGAIHHAHQRGILHRDLKPANILVDAEGQPHVTDFGLAKRVEGESELTQSGAILGTPAYMAPEQASGKRGAVTTVTDVYGLGAVLYVLLAGRAPFGGDSVIDTLEQVRERSPVPPTKRNPRAPRDLEVICLKSLEKDPRRRYDSAEALAEDLRRWLAGEPITARPVGNAARLWMWCRRNPVVAGAAGLVAAALVAVAVLSLLYADRQRRLANTERLRADERAEYARRRAEDAEKITIQANDLKVQSQALKFSLDDSSRRLAMLYFERAQRSFENGQVNFGLVWLVETWRYALKSNDKAWQNLARANLSFWRYNSPEIKGIPPHRGSVTSVAFSPSGKTVLTIGADNTARLWDPSTSMPIGEPMAHTARVLAVAFSPDGKSIVTGGRNDGLQKWNADTGELIGDVRPPGFSVNAVSFSPDSKRILTGSADHTARVWDSSTLHPITLPMVHRAEVCCVAFSPNGKTLLTGSDDSTARLWDAASGSPIAPPLVHNRRVVCVAFSPDGNTILTASYDGTAKLWDVATGKAIRQPFQHESPVLSAAFSADGESVLTTNLGSNTAWLWDAASDRAIAKPLNHQSTIVAVAFSWNGKAIVTCSRDQSSRLWDSATGQALADPVVHPRRIHCVAFSPDGETVATGGDGAWLWDAITDRPRGQPMQYDGSVNSVRYSGDGKRIVTCDNRDSHTVQVWEARTGLPVGQPLVNDSAFRIDCIELSFDGDLVITGDGDHCVRIWEVASGNQIGRTLVHQDRVLCVAFSRDGASVMTGGDDSIARLWDTGTGRHIGQPMVHQGSVKSVAFSFDGKTVLTASVDRTARLWDVATGRPIGAPLRLSSSIEAAVYSSDGETFVARSTDGACQLADAHFGSPIGAPFVTRPATIPVCWSADGKTLVGWSGGKAVQLRDGTTGLPIGPPLEQDGVNPNCISSLAFSPDGQSVVVVTENDRLRPDGSTIRLWHLPQMVYDDFTRMAIWVETTTGLAINEDGEFRALKSAVWQERRRRLRELGGPPRQASEWVFEPIIFGPEPFARVRAWIDRKCFENALSAFSDAIRGRQVPARSTANMIQALILAGCNPRRLTEIVSTDRAFDRILAQIPVRSRSVAADFLSTRAELFARQSEWYRADADFREASLLHPPDPLAAFHQILTLLAAGDHHRARQVSSGLVERLQNAAFSWTVDDIVWCLLMTPDAVHVPGSVAMPGAASVGPGFAIFPDIVTDTRNKLILERLEQPIVVSFKNETPLDEVLKYIKTVTSTPNYAGIPVRVDPIGLAEAGITLTATVKFELERVPLKTALRRILDKLGLAYTVHKGFLVITSKASAEGSNSGRVKPTGGLQIISVPTPNGRGFTKARGATSTSADRVAMMPVPSKVAALYRFGLCKDAITCWEQEAGLRDHDERAIDWPFVAMAYHKIGCDDEARRWLDKLRTRRLNTEATSFWIELALRLLRTEAEAVILYDPIFPSDPFGN